MLINEKKQRYSLFCEREDWIPIFSQPWWMDCTCGADNWDVFLIGNGNDIQAALPYYIVDTEKGKCIKRATLTQNNGLLIKYPSNTTNISRQKYDEKIVNEVCDFLENLGIASYQQQYNYRFDFWLPFFWRFYKGVVKYTYVIDNCTDYEAVYKQYSSKVKNALRKAQNEVNVSDMDDVDLFYKVNEMSFTRQNVEIPYSKELFMTLLRACRERHCCRLIKAEDEAGNIHAVAMLVWDAKAVYFLLNGANPEIRNSQANVAIIDESIKTAGKLNLKFDFEGSVIKAVNHAFREYGGIPRQYFNISKDYV